MGWFGKKEICPTGPDYSSIDTMDKAQDAAKSGELVPLLLLPLEFGGSPIPENIIYVPHFVAEMKHSTDENVIASLAEAGNVTRYAAEPKYSGKSVVPISLRIGAYDPTDFTYDIAIWGDGLGKN